MCFLVSWLEPGRWVFFGGELGDLCGESFSEVYKESGSFSSSRVRFSYPLLPVLYFLPLLSSSLSLMSKSSLLFPLWVVLLWSLSYIWFDVLLFFLWQFWVCILPDILQMLSLEFHILTAEAVSSNVLRKLGMFLRGFLSGIQDPKSNRLPLV